MIKAIDPYAGYINLPQGLYDNFAVVTPSDTDDLEYIASKLWIPVVWNTETKQIVEQQIVIEPPGKLGNQAFKFVTAGGIIDWPTRIKKVWATGTTADSIIAFW